MKTCISNTIQFYARNDGSDYISGNRAMLTEGSIVLGNGFPSLPTGMMYMVPSISTIQKTLSTAWVPPEPRWEINDDRNTPIKIEIKRSHGQTPFLNRLVSQFVTYPCLLNANQLLFANPRQIFFAL